MAKEKQKMTLNVRRRVNTTSNGTPPAVDATKIEAFAAGVEKNQAVSESVAANQKVIRDAFTMPADDHKLFQKIQNRCLMLGMVVTKSEIVRAGLRHFDAIDDKKLEKIVRSIPKLKIGRPNTTKSSK